MDDVTRIKQRIQARYYPEYHKAAWNDKDSRWATVARFDNEHMNQIIMGMLVSLVAFFVVPVITAIGVGAGLSMIVVNAVSEGKVSDIAIANIETDIANGKLVERYKQEYIDTAEKRQVDLQATLDEIPGHVEALKKASCLEEFADAAQKAASISPTRYAPVIAPRP